jgi:hypothetical protein
VNIVSYDTSRVTILFPFEEVVPLGGVNTRGIIEEVKTRYKFLKGADPPSQEKRPARPDSSSRLDNLSFAVRTQTLPRFRFIAMEWSLSQILLKLQTLFLDDTILWMRSEFGFKNFSTQPKRYHLSQLVVEFDKPLYELIRRYGSIVEAIAKHTSQIFQTDASMNFARIDLEFEKNAVKTPMNIARFIIDRRVGIPFGRERYFCSAPLKTVDHIDVLEQVEAALG